MENYKKVHASRTPQLLDNDPTCIHVTANAKISVYARYAVLILQGKQKDAAEFAKQHLYLNMDKKKDERQQEEEKKNDQNQIEPPQASAITTTRIHVESASYTPVDKITILGVGNAIPNAIIIAEVVKQSFNMDLASTISAPSETSQSASSEATTQPVVSTSTLTSTSIRIVEQISEISSTELIDRWEPINEGPEPIEEVRRVSTVKIILATKIGVLDRNAPGFQADLLDTVHSQKHKQDLLHLFEQDDLSLPQYQQHNNKQYSVPPHRPKQNFHGQDNTSTDNKNSHNNRNQNKNKNNPATNIENKDAEQIQQHLENQQDLPSNTTGNKDRPRNRNRRRRNEKKKNDATTAVLTTTSATAPTAAAAAAAAAGGSNTAPTATMTTTTTTTVMVTAHETTQLSSGDADNDHALDNQPQNQNQAKRNRNRRKKKAQKASAEPAGAPTQLDQQASSNNNNGNSNNQSHPEPTFSSPITDHDAGEKKQDMGIQQNQKSKNRNKYRNRRTHNKSTNEPNNDTRTTTTATDTPAAPDTTNKNIKHNVNQPTENPNKSNTITQQQPATEAAT